MSSVVISIAKESDLHLLQQLRMGCKSKFVTDKEDDSDAKSFRMLKRRKFGRVLLAKVGDVVVGTASCVSHPLDQRVCWIYRLVVKDEYVRTGVGSMLMKRVEEHAKFNDAMCVMLSVVHDNIIAKDFYTALGYIAGGDVDYSTHSELMFRKDL